MVHLSILLFWYELRVHALGLVHTDADSVATYHLWAPQHITAHWCTHNFTWYVSRRTVTSGTLCVRIYAALK